MITKDLGTSSGSLADGESRLAGTAQVGHTPGPWTVGRPEAAWDRDIVGPNGEDIGFVNSSDGADDPTEYPLDANACLIAAAPDMLVALKAAEMDLVNQMEQIGYDESEMADDPALAIVRAAIAKAESRS